MLGVSDGQSVYKYILEAKFTATSATSQHICAQQLNDCNAQALTGAGQIL